MAGKHVLVVGGTSLDTIIHLYSPLRPGPESGSRTIGAKACYQAVGGTGAGKALNLAHLGFDVTLHTCLSEDQAGKSVREELSHSNIELLVEAGQMPTEQHTNLMTPDGGRTSIYTHPPENPKSFCMQEITDAMQKTDIAAVSILDYTRPVLQLAKEFNKPLWIDLHDYDGKNEYHQEFLDAADVVFLSSDNLPDYRSFMQEQINAGKSLVVCTHGKQGATALDKNGTFYQQPIIERYELVDSNGAGDAFFSGFLYAYIHEKSVAESMLAGAMVAGMCINSTLLYATALSSDALETALQALQ